VAEVRANLDTPVSTRGQESGALKDPLDQGRPKEWHHQHSVWSRQVSMQTIDFTPWPHDGPSALDLRAIVDSLPVVVWTGRADDSGLDFASRPFLAYTGLELRQALGWGWTDTVHPDDRERLVESVNSIVATGRSAETEVRLRRADGIYRWFLFRGAPRLDPSGAVVGWSGVNTDIEHQRRSFDSLPGMVCMNTPDGQIEHVNATTLQYTGYTLEEIRNWPITVHPDDVATVAARKAHSMATGEPFDVDVRVRRADGVFRWFHCLGMPFRDSDGRIIRWYDLLSDIDDRKRAEEALRRSEAFLLEVQRLSRTGGFRFDPATGKVESSTEIERAYMVRPEDDLSSPEFWFGRIHPDDRARVQATFERSVRLLTDYRADYRVIRGDGSIGYQQAVGRPVLNDTGGLVEFIGASMDMTEQWMAATELTRASQTVQEMQQKLSRAAQVATVGEMAAAIAHEVNQPLAAVVANGHACLRWLSSPTPNIDRAVEAAERIVKDGRDAGEVVRRVRSLFKRAPIEDVALTLNDVVRDVLRLLDADIAMRRVTVAVILEPALPAIRGDRVQLQQLVWNLTLNALDAVAGVSARVRQVSIHTRRSDRDQAVIEVCDNGIGLANPEAVFEPFFTTKTNGMGMGLAICRSIAAAHEGTVSARRNSDYGTTFSFAMPVAPDALT
jgi:PAS domain S-box-containing protein